MSNPDNAPAKKEAYRAKLQARKRRDGNTDRYGEAHAAVMRSEGYSA